MPVLILHFSHLLCVCCIYSSTLHSRRGRGLTAPKAIEPKRTLCQPHKKGRAYLVADLHVPMTFRFDEGWPRTLIEQDTYRSTELASNPTGEISTKSSMLSGRAQDWSWNYMHIDSFPIWLVISCCCSASCTL